MVPTGLLIPERSMSRRRAVPLVAIRAREVLCRDTSPGRGPVPAPGRESGHGEHPVRTGQMSHHASPLKPWARLRIIMAVGPVRRPASRRKGGIMSRRLLLPHLPCLLSLLVGSPVTAQSAWTKAPPLPRACYSGQDPFHSEAAAVMSELEAAIGKQDLINRGLADQVLNMDPATLQQRMMAAMQKNPARAQEIMEAFASIGTGHGQGQADAMAAEAQAAAGEFEAKKTKLIADYKADKVRVMSLYGGRPAPAREQAVTGNLGPTDPAVLAENNEKYRTVLCPKWFAKEVPALLASYRTYLVEQRIPWLTAAEEKATRMAELFGVSTKDFRPIAEMQAVVDYLRLATELFGLRESEPLKQV